MAMKIIAANPIPITNVRIQLAGRFSPMSANVSPRNRINPHVTPTNSILPIASNTNPLSQLIGAGITAPRTASRRNVTATSATMSIK
jgi:hypothetical protein